MEGVHNHIEVRVCASPEEAIAKGYNYQQPEYKAINVKHVVVVQKGTEGGGSTVDFVLEDETGQKHVFMITAALLQTISGI